MPPASFSRRRAADLRRGGPATRCSSRAWRSPTSTGPSRRSSGGAYVNDFTRFGRPMEGVHPGRVRGSARPRTSAASTSGTPPATWCPAAPTLVTLKNIAGPEYTRALQPLPRRRGHRAASPPGYSSGRRCARFEEVAHPDLPPEMGYAWTNALLPAKKASEGGAPVVFGLALVMVFLILAAPVRELVASLQPCCSARRIASARRPGRRCWSRNFELRRLTGRSACVMLIGLAAKNAILDRRVREVLE